MDYKIKEMTHKDWDGVANLIQKENRMLAREKGLFKEKCPKYIEDAINILEHFL